jgi:tetratricopeptide (TPR) repeat protein
MKKAATLFFLICLGFFANSQSNEDLAAKARKAYDAGQFQQAIQLYEKILKNGQESVVLYYNLGNSYFRNNEIPSAILYYEKALKIEPNHDDIQHNLLVANSRITDKVEIVPELFYKRWWKSFINTLGIDSAGIVLIILLTLALLSTAIYLVARTVAIRKVFFWNGIAFFFLFLVSLYAAQQKEHQLMNHHEAIVFTPTVTVKSSPDLASKDLFVIHEGIKVVLLDQIGEWQEIRIANGSIGWLRTFDIRLI